MNNFESNVQYIKYLVNKEVAYRFFQGILIKGPSLERGYWGNHWRKEMENDILLSCFCRLCP